MMIPETELPRERRLEDTKCSDQLTLIIHHTNKWLNLLFHDFNGLLGNVNWITRLMGEQDFELNALPKDAFKELNLSTQLNIYSLKAIQHYIQLLNAVAGKRSDTNRVLVSESMLLSALSKWNNLRVQVQEDAIKVSSVFAKVLLFLLNKAMEAAAQLEDKEPLLNISICETVNHALQVCISDLALAEGLVLQLWPQENNPAPTDPLSGDSSLWGREMFYEMLAVVGGKQLSGCTCKRKAADEGASDWLQAVPDEPAGNQQHFTFCLPFSLEAV